MAIHDDTTFIMRQRNTPFWQAKCQETGEILKKKKVNIKRAASKTDRTVEKCNLREEDVEKRDAAVGAALSLV